MLENDKIVLRAPDLSDLDLLFNWENQVKLWYLSNTLLPFSRFDLEQFILQGNHDIYADKQFRFMIADKSNNEVLGCVDIFDFDAHHERAGLGILIDEKYRNKGWASESLELIIDYAFKQLKLHQLYCNILSSNSESLNLFKKKHFSKIGVKQDWVFIEGEYHDEILLQLIRKN